MYTYIHKSSMYQGTMLISHEEMLRQVEFLAVYYLNKPRCIKHISFLRNVRSYYMFITISSNNFLFYYTCRVKTMA